MQATPRQRESINVQRVNSRAVSHPRGTSAARAVATRAKRRSSGALPLLSPSPQPLNLPVGEQHHHHQKQQQEQQQLHEEGPKCSITRRAVLLPVAAAAAALLWPAQAARAAPIPGAGGNAAVLESLRKMKKQQRFEDSLSGEDPRTALAGRFEAVQGQLQKCILLVKINQYDSARLQLREGAFKSLRLDLGYGQEMYRLVSGKEVREVVEGVERLDGALKRRESLEVLEPIITGLGERLKAISEAAARIEEIS